MMNDDEAALAIAIYEAIQASSSRSERSQQSADFRIGPSDLGFCSERVRRMLDGIPEPETDKLPAFIGTAIGEHVEKAVLEYLWPEATVQATVEATLQGQGGRTYTLTGHPDIIYGNRVIDVKTVNGLEMKRRSGPDQQQQFQRHVYALGAFEGGHLDVDSLDEVEVANIWIDRSGAEREAHVQMEPFSMEVVRAAAEWIDEIVYIYSNGGEARKEPPYNMCAKACGHFEDCRMGESSAEGLITDIEALTGVQMLMEAKEMEATARRLKNQAQLALKGVEGSTGEFTVRWTEVGGGPVSYNREPYMRLDIRKVKK